MTEPGRRFLERSPMLTQRLWPYERPAGPAPQGCVVRDEVHFEPRVRRPEPFCRHTARRFRAGTAAGTAD